MYSGSAWLVSTRKGEIVRVNGLAGRVDAAPVGITRPGDAVQVVQTDDLVLVAANAYLSSIDPRLLAPTRGASLQSAGARILATGKRAYVLDPASETVYRLDPRTLRPAGPMVALPGRAGDTALQEGGERLWVALPDLGALTLVENDVAGMPVPAGAPGPHLVFARVAGQTWVLNGNDGTAGQLRADGATSRRIQLGADYEGTALLPAAGDSPLLVFALPGSRRLAVLEPGREQPRIESIPVAVGPLGAPLVADGLVYVPDEGSGRLAVYDLARHEFKSPISVTATAATDLELFRAGGMVWANAMSTPDAVAVYDGVVHRIVKYGEPAAPPIAPSPTRTPAATAPPNPNPNPKTPASAIPTRSVPGTPSAGPAAGGAGPSSATPPARATSPARGGDAGPSGEDGADDAATGPPERVPDLTGDDSTDSARRPGENGGIPITRRNGPYTHQTAFGRVVVEAGNGYVDVSWELPAGEGGPTDLAWMAGARGGGGAGNGGPLPPGSTSTRFNVTYTGDTPTLTFSSAANTFSFDIRAWELCDFCNYGHPTYTVPLRDAPHGTPIGTALPPVPDGQMGNQVELHCVAESTVEYADPVYPGRVGTFAWYKITYQGATGYVPTNYISIPDTGMEPRYAVRPC
ncbi:hypothetical protein Franean1_4250 [Parafrankia sp. EAN1pec]|nr:hypothetical protein Franean1_4250 [Frankia sp. EAN1pec]